MWLVFKFNSKEQCDAILKGRPYIVYSCPLYLKAMSEFFTFKPNVPAQMPLWMQLYGLPVDFWSTTGLSKIASQVGLPLYTDLFTKMRGRVNFARVLVEVDITKELPKSTTVMLPDGRREHLQLRFETVLKFCSFCKNLGHYRPHCTLAPINGNQANQQQHQMTILPRSVTGNGNTMRQAESVAMTAPQRVSGTGPGPISGSGAVARKRSATPLRVGCPATSSKHKQLEF
ncbi:uncharacterized protein LOC122054843 [Zingiber officinale]|uniref:uncharacterized protein LOC122054843 n=1 Tax=Zingiber officinale TaxID=94328 RepID=UPI001C4A930E|nr:uncharacterized protein LOC122054843 [Zingiber officinale]